MSLLPEKQNFTMWKGATFRANLTLYVDEGITPRDLTDYTGLLEIRATGDEGSAIFTLSSENDRITFADDGVISLYISAEDTQVEWDKGVYDLLITAPEGDTDAILYGNFVAKGV